MQLVAHLAPTQEPSNHAAGIGPFTHPCLAGGATRTHLTQETTRNAACTALPFGIITFILSVSLAPDSDPRMGASEPAACRWAGLFSAWGSPRQDLRSLSLSRRCADRNLLTYTSTKYSLSLCKLGIYLSVVLSGHTKVRLRIYSPDCEIIA